MCSGPIRQGLPIAFVFLSKSLAEEEECFAPYAPHRGAFKFEQFKLWVELFNYFELWVEL